MIIHGDARHLPLREACVDCVVTSPPYFGLRDYGVTGQIGLEPTPDAYVAAMVGVFREVRRVLKPEGTCWLNLGDSYFGGGTDGGQFGSKRPKVKWDRKANRETVKRGNPHPDHGLKFKDLMGIPWLVAQALQQPWYRCEFCEVESHKGQWLMAPATFQEDEILRIGFCPECCSPGPMHLSESGWYLRSDIIWHKPNPMPESVTDRPTKAHEDPFLLTKSASYHYDADAIAEPASVAMLQQVEQGYDGLGLKDYAAAGVQNPSSVKARIIEGARLKAKQRLDRDQVGAASQLRSIVSDDGDRYMSGRTHAKYAAANGQPLTRNRRTVWTIPTLPYAGAHFATMPEALVEPCILAGCPLGGLVLDPFLGSGTVGAVAERLGRRWAGVDLNPAYHVLGKARTAQRGLRFEAEVIA